MIFNRENSTLAVMDDLQIAVHTYDGCERGCSGCIVEKDFKNRMRGTLLLSTEQLKIIQTRVEEYYDWIVKNLNTKEKGYFGKNGYKVNHYSYTMRFGNHCELPYEKLCEISEHLKSEFRVFSTAPNDQLYKIFQLKKDYPGRYFLELIFDPTIDTIEEIKNMILEMRANDVLGYPELLITSKVIKHFTPEDFIKKVIEPVGNIDIQMQFGRYSPSKTRNYNRTQLVPLDKEVEWLTEVSRLIVQNNYSIHPIPIGEYAVTFLDEYKESLAQRPDGSIDESLLVEEEFNIQNVMDKTRDIFLTSLYIDEKLDLYLWSESMGQHVLDKNFGFESLGNIEKKSIIELVTDPNGKLEQMLKNTIKHLMTHKKCSSCRYKSFCASHAIPLFRKFHEDDGKYCYGYLPVIREFQKGHKFLQNMIDGFKELNF